MKLKKLPLGPILGSRTHSTDGYSQKFLLRGSSSKSEKVCIRVTSADGFPPYDRADSSKVTKKTDYTHVFTFDDLPEKTEFTYIAGIVSADKSTAALNKRTLTGGIEGSFRTGDPDTNVTSFSFGSCRHGDVRNKGTRRKKGKRRGVRRPKPGKYFDDRCFKVMLKECPDDDFVLMCGDQIYGDHSVGGGFIPKKPKNLTLDHYLKHYQKYFARQHIGKVMASRPTYMILDDHEVKDNWSGGAFEHGAKGFKRKQVLKDALKAYDIYQVSHSPIGGEEKKNYYYEFSHGRCDFFVMDTRSERDLDPDCIIQSEQLNAVKEFLERGKDRIKFLVSPSPMFPEAARNPISKLFDWDPEDRWEGYPKQRKVLLEAMKSTIDKGDNKNIVVLTGDVHSSFFYRLVHKTDDNFRIHQITSSAFHWIEPLPGLNDINFDEKKPLGGAESYLPQRLPPGKDGKVITDHNFCRVEVKNKIIEITFYKFNGKIARRSRISLK